MKKIFTIIAIAFFSFTACQPVEPSFLPSSGDEGYSISGTIIPCLPDTRVTYDIGSTHVTPSWSVGDEIFGIDDAGDTFTFICTEVDPSTGRAKFIIKPNSTYTVINNRELYAVYFPGHGESEICENDEGEKVLNVNIWSQTGRLDDSLPAIMTATGTVSDNIVEFAFENQLYMIGAENIEMSDLSTYNNTSFNQIRVFGIVTIGQLRFGESMSVVPFIDSEGDVNDLVIEGNWTINDGSINVTNQDGTPLVFAAIPFNSYSYQVFPNFSLAFQNETSRISISNNSSADALTKNKYYDFVTFSDFNIRTNTSKSIRVSDGISSAEFPVDQAFSLASHNDADITLSLTEDLTLKSNVIFNGNDGGGKVTLDLNGHDLTLDSCYFRISNGRRFTLTDISAANAAQQGTVSGDRTSYLIYSTGSSEVSVEGGNIVNSKSDGYAVYLANGTGTVSGGSIRSAHVGVAVASNASLTVSGGEIRGNTRSIYNWGSTTVTGGKFKTTTSSAVISQGESSLATIRGGYFSSESSTTELFTISQSGRASVTGGCFDRPVAANRTTASYQNALNGDLYTNYTYPYTVTEGSVAVRTVKGTTVYYHSGMGSAAEHVRSCQSDNSLTLRLMDDVVHNEALDLTNTAGRSITLDLNGHTLLTTASPFLSTSGTLTVTDSTRTTGLIMSSASQVVSLTSAGASLLIEGCTLTSSQAEGSSYTEAMVYMGSADGTLTIRDARIASLAKLSVLRAYNGTVDIYSSELSSGRSGESDTEGWYVLIAANLATLNVHSGSFFTTGTENASTCHISNVGAHVNVLADGDTYFYSNGRTVSSGNKSYYTNLKLWGGYYNKMPSVPSSGTGSDVPAYADGVSMQAVDPAVTFTPWMSGAALQYGYRVY